MKAQTHEARPLTRHEAATLACRGLAAWLATDEAMRHPQPDTARGEVHSLTDSTGHVRHFVRVVAGGCVLAVFRVRNDSRVLRRLVRVPGVLAEA